MAPILNKMKPPLNLPKAHKKHLQSFYLRLISLAYLNVKLNFPYIKRDRFTTCFKTFGTCNRNLLRTFKGGYLSKPNFLVCLNIHKFMVNTYLGMCTYLSYLRLICSDNLA